MSRPSADNDAGRAGTRDDAPATPLRSAAAPPSHPEVHDVRWRARRERRGHSQPRRPVPRSRGQATARLQVRRAGPRPHAGALIESLPEDTRDLAALLRVAAEDGPRRRPTTNLRPRSCASARPRARSHPAGRATAAPTASPATSPGSPEEYLVAQLVALRSGARRNDSEAQMRAMARPMTDREIDEVATFYARKAAAAGIQGH